MPKIRTQPILASHDDGRAYISIELILMNTRAQVKNIVCEGKMEAGLKKKNGAKKKNANNNKIKSASNQNYESFLKKNYLPWWSGCSEVVHVLAHTRPTEESTERKEKETTK